MSEATKERKELTQPSGSVWSSGFPAKAGWYWIRAKNLSQRIVRVYKPKGCNWLTHDYTYSWASTETWERYGPFEYAGPIPSPNNVERGNPDEQPTK